MKYLGSQTKLKLNNSSITYGTCNIKNSNGFFINLSFWLKLEGELEPFSKERDSQLHHFRARMSSRIRGMVSSISDNYLYSFNVVDLSDSFYKKKNDGFGSAEIQVFLKKPFKDFTKDMVLKAEIESFCRILDNSIQEIIPHFVISKNKGHVNPNKKVLVSI